MTPLSQLSCQACHGNALALPESEQIALMSQLPNWQKQNTQEGQRLSRVFKFKAYLDGVGFTVQLAELAEQVQHHPQITLEWGKVTVTWWTHTLNGLHLNDFIMAAQTDSLFQGNRR